MKISFGIIVFNGDHVLEQAIKSVYPYAHQILISEGPVSYWQSKGFNSSNDSTIDIIKNFPDPENKIISTHGCFKEKDDQCNAYMKHLKDDADYIWNLDCDEIFKPEDIETVISLLKSERYTSVGFKSTTFYGGFDKYLTGFEESAEFIRIRKVYPGSFWKTHRPPTIEHVYPGDKLPEKHLDFNFLSSNYGVRMYHYSYVFPRQVYNKVLYYSEFLNKNNNIPDYYNNVYKPWVLGSDIEKETIENTYHGVHEWLPRTRGPCRTSNFKGDHPEVISSSIEGLKSNLKQELELY